MNQILSPHGLYATLEEPGTNPLRAAYAMPANADPLAFLLALNLNLATKEKAGEPITPPGLPRPESERSKFVTDDCVQIAHPHDILSDIAPVMSRRDIGY